MAKARKKHRGRKHARRSSRLNLFGRTNPRRFVVKHSKKRRAKKPYRCVDKRSRKTVARGGHAGTAAYCYNLAKRSAHPKWHAKANPTKKHRKSRKKHSKRVHRNPTHSKSLNMKVTALTKRLDHVQKHQIPALAKGMMLLGKAVAKHKGLPASAHRALPAHRS